MKKDKVPLLTLIFLLVLIIVCLTVASRETLAPVISGKTLKPDTLDSGRQVIEVQVDSLIGLLRKLRAGNETVFTYQYSHSKLVIRCKPEMQTTFNRIFLNESNLESFSAIENSSLDVDVHDYEFAMQVKTYRGVQFVKMPAEVMQSMLLSTVP